MSLSLDVLAKTDLYKIIPEYDNLFNALDNVCIPQYDKSYICDSFESADIPESFKGQLQKIFNILKRSKDEKDIYINTNILGKHKSCVFYKYWFFHKIIKHNSDEIDIRKLYEIWNINTIGIYGALYGGRCKFHAETLEDVKIMKILYDHIFFFNNTSINSNALDKIKKCEYCNHLKNYLSNTFRHFPIKCTVGSSYSLCREYNDHLQEIIDLDELSSLSCESGENASHCPLYSKLREQDTEGMESVIAGREDLTSRTQENSEISGSNENLEGNNIDVKNIIGGTSVLGIPFILFYLYKFTSFGSLIRRRTGWIAKMLKNSQENKDELILRDSETENINFDNIQYNLAYTTVHDY
ncbi:PIR Superfamily Protein [Plasmodium ovale wallikeri]|uniref:PIR Superfamily Protein n=2 Tax=Plasmodium ovale TaxID=36330 RepID=A0A1A9AQD3_PLAOA|nr:PIR Superfamily Protein [Plasmodium ovale wallikeri]SBT58421.1 PIR Superfamily Protein [Plasmodium ovale wallikeri]SBT73161.1 Plasmodium vivax Vir protein, putative [Plasmodium ovale]